MNERIRCPHWLRLQIGWLTSVEKCRANGAHGLRQTEAAAAAEADAATEAAAEAAKAAASALSSHCLFCNNDLAHSRRSEHTEPEGGGAQGRERLGRRGAGSKQSTTAERAVKSVSQHNTHKELFCELRLRLGE